MNARSVRRKGSVVAVAHLALIALLLAGCAAAAAPTPQIIYVTAPPQPSVAAPTPIVIYVTPAPPPSGTVHTITGTFALLGNNWISTLTKDHGSDCRGTSGYADIGTGTTVIVKDQAATIIATDELVFTLEEPGCTFVFTVPNVPDAPFYTIEVSHRGGLTYSQADLAAANWHVDLTLGQ